MNIEDLVPPLELCKKIPEGMFADSVFVWVFNHQKARKAYPATAEDDAYFDLELRDIVEAGEQAVEKGKEVWTNRPPYYPAPTLAEILAELEEFELRKNNITDESYIESEFVQYEDKNAATAALKLWLKLKGIE